MRPRPSTLPKPPKDAPKEYQEGWNNGCESGLAVYGNDFYKTFYGYKVDVGMLKNKTYYKAWNDAFHYCRAFINRYLADGYWGEKLFGPYQLRDRKVIEGWGLGFGYGYVNTPGWSSDPYSYDRGIPGFNQNIWEGGGTDFMDFGGGTSDWLGRPPEYQTDWLGRTKEYRPQSFLYPYDGSDQ